LFDQSASRATRQVSLRSICTPAVNQQDHFLLVCVLFSASRRLLFRGSRSSAASYSAAALAKSLLFSYNLPSHSCADECGGTSAFGSTFSIYSRRFCSACGISFVSTDATPR